MSTCIPSPGPMWATWLKLVGLEIILDLSSGSLSISLGKKASGIHDRERSSGPALAATARPAPPSPPLLQPLLLWDLEDEPPLAPGPQHLLPAVVRGVGHAEHSSCGKAGPRSRRPPGRGRTGAAG